MVIHTVKSFGIVNKAEIDVFLEFSCFFHDPMDVGNFNLPTDVGKFNAYFFHIYPVFAVLAIVRDSEFLQ